MPVAARAAREWVRPSTSLATSTALMTAASSMWGGRGSCTRMQYALVALKFAAAASSSSATRPRKVSPKSVIPAATPSSSCARMRVVEPIPTRMTASPAAPAAPPATTSPHLCRDGLAVD